MSEVSVVVPVYNAGNKLHTCIQSVLKQTYTNFELILVNDGSTDHSFHVCMEYQEKDSRIKVIHKQNEGSIIARRTGIEAASSPYIMFVDADDWLDHRILETLYHEAKQDDIDIIVCNFYKVVSRLFFIRKSNQSQYFQSEKIYSGDEIKNQLAVAYLHGHPFPSTLYAKLFKKELLLSCGNLLGNIRFLGDDLFYNLEMFLKASKVKVIVQPLYYYRLGGFTSRYLPYLFDDMVEGYEIQKSVIAQYYQESYQEQLRGSSIMLLNTFQTCLRNVFMSTLNEADTKKLYAVYCQNNSVLEAVRNEGSRQYFDQAYLNAILKQDAEYLYQLGYAQHKKQRVKRLVLNTLAKVSW